MLEQVRVCMVVICVVGFLFQFCLGQSDAQAKEEGASQIDKEEFEQRLRDLNNRFRDFYLHRRYRLEENERRLEAADDYRDRRQKREEKIEAQRKEFIRLRDAAPVLENNEEEHLKEKEEQKKQKEEAKNKEKNPLDRPRVFVLSFDGDVRASQVERLRQEISILLQVAGPSDEVLIRVESPGGMVHGYGLAAAQLMRIRKKSIPLTVAVDKVAASGGYLMACTADRILAAPFAIVGSIGVLAQVPNFSRLLKKHDVDYEEFTAGEYKRTISMLGEITEKGRQKFTDQIEDTHKLFKEFVANCRPQLQLEKVATGEHWYGERALDLNLIDEIKTSDEWLIEKMKEKEVFHLEIAEKKSLSEKFSEVLGKLSAKIYDQIFSQFRS